GFTAGGSVNPSSARRASIFDMRGSVSQTNDNAPFPDNTLFADERRVHAPAAAVKKTPGTRPGGGECSLSRLTVVRNREARITRCLELVRPIISRTVGTGLSES